MVRKHKPTDKAIVAAARYCLTLAGFMRRARYSTDHPGGNTMIRLRRVIGKRVYNELSKGHRMFKPREQWVLPK